MKTMSGMWPPPSNNRLLLSHLVGLQSFWLHLGNDILVSSRTLPETIQCFGKAATAVGIAATAGSTGATSISLRNAATPPT